MSLSRPELEELERLNREATRECHKCRGSGKYLIPSCDMELPAFSNICDVCGGSGRISLPDQAKEKPDAK